MRRLWQVACSHPIVRNALRYGVASYSAAKNQLTQRGDQ